MFNFREIYTFSENVPISLLISSKMKHTIKQVSAFIVSKTGPTPTQRHHQ